MLIFLDVDGVLIPMRTRTVGLPAPADDTGNPLLHRLDPRDGARILSLGGEPVWATTWMHDANETGGALLHRVDPLVGLADTDLATVRRWLTG